MANTFRFRPRTTLFITEFSGTTAQFLRHMARSGWELHANGNGDTTTWYHSGYGVYVLMDRTDGGIGS